MLLLWDGSLSMMVVLPWCGCAAAAWQQTGESWWVVGTPHCLFCALPVEARHSRWHQHGGRCIKCDHCHACLVHWCSSVAPALEPYSSAPPGLLAAGSHRARGMLPQCMLVLGHLAHMLVTVVHACQLSVHAPTNCIGKLSCPCQMICSRVCTG